MRRRVLIVLAGLAVLLAAAVVAFVVHRLQEAGNVRGSSTVDFITTETRPVVEQSAVPWPTYGFDVDRTRAVELALAPPYRTLWRYQAASLVEFPPSIGYGRLYFSTNAGALTAINATTGKRAWKTARTAA